MSIRFSNHHPPFPAPGHNFASSPELHIKQPTKAANVATLGGHVNECSDNLDSVVMVRTRYVFGSASCNTQYGALHVLDRLSEEWTERQMKGEKRRAEWGGK
ncbi:hypothetical protein RSOLAG1IB_11983 [Rhizoctonia solani AG-1 IB]|uniref:Uncharacterized protein n=1 Tax=Thanatephorus cucumeris (strain AG1-IB / isolate 7/3/14) TaxID=1108050 RepID=A0A0B7FGF8_THACB|nr:hypothetical protein RSOLAG1IB_11983 [Rhizoctonia solani AG-1 IB]